MKATLFTAQIALACLPFTAFAQAIDTGSSNDFSARTMRVRYLPQQEGGDTVVELTDAYVRVDASHVFTSSSATARIAKGPLGETILTADTGVVVSETTPASTMHYPCNVGVGSEKFRLGCWSRTDGVELRDSSVRLPGDDVQARSVRTIDFFRFSGSSSGIRRSSTQPCRSSLRRHTRTAACCWPG